MDRSMGHTDKGHDNFIGYPTNRVVGTFDDEGEALAAVDELASAGFDKSCSAYCGTSGASRLDSNAKDRRPLAWLSRALHHLDSMETAQMDRYERELLDGHCLVMVEAADIDRRARALEILRSHGGHFINYYGRWVIETLQS